MYRMNAFFSSAIEEHQAGWRRVIQRSVIGAIRRSLEVDYTVLQRHLERADGE